MADTEQILRGAAGSKNAGDNNALQQKRKSQDGSHENSSSKKVMRGDGGGNQRELGRPTGPIKISMAGKAKKAEPSVVDREPKKLVVAPIKMSLSAAPKAKVTEKPSAPVMSKTKQVASVFNESDSEEEEMPHEAKMRMRNVGRETPTAAGPNSFGKGSLGFCDRTKMIEREMKKQMDDYLQKNTGKD